jgi:hypothetical protein
LLKAIVVDAAAELVELDREIGALFNRGLGLGGTDLGAADITRWVGA